ncbi:MAG: CHAP domain-containing protein [Ruminococcus sp.]|nr:CHAP domain-containing protein [Ruminococcus sp.]
MKSFVKRAVATAVGCTMLVSSSGMTASAVGMTYPASDSYKSGVYFKNISAVQLTGDQRVDIVAVAQSQLGYHEGSNANDLSGNSTGSGNFAEYGKRAGNVSMGWCAAFVSWCADQARVPSSIIKRQYTADNITKQSKTGLFGGTFKAYGTYIPKPGDIVYWDTNEPLNNNSDHVEIVVAVSGSTITSIGGNSSEKVKTHTVDLSSSDGFSYFHILGFEVPNYTSSAAATTTTTTVTTTVTTTTETTTTVPVTTEPPFEPEYSYGDVDGDGTVDASDASLLLAEYAARQTNTANEIAEEASQYADIDGDGFVDATDASIVLQYYSYVQTGGDSTLADYMENIYSAETETEDPTEEEPPAQPSEEELADRPSDQDSETELIEDKPELNTEEQLQE